MHVFFHLLFKYSILGIVSPYRAQCRLLKSECARINANEIAIGTAEVFQGQERTIMIISTVRTDADLGFVKNERVCFFKKSMLIIILNSFLILISEIKCNDYAREITADYHW